MVQSSLDLVDRDCCLLDGDCKCYRPQKDCKYLGKEVFFGKKGERLTKEEKLLVLRLSRDRSQKKKDKFDRRIERISKLIEAIESTK